MKGTNTLKLLGKKTPKSKWIKVLGFWIKDNGSLELSHHVKKRRSNGYKEERRVQHWTLGCITTSMRARRDVFIMRYKQKFF